MLVGKGIEDSYVFRFLYQFKGCETMQNAKSHFVQTHNKPGLKSRMRLLTFQGNQTETTVY